MKTDLCSQQLAGWPTATLESISVRITSGGTPKRLTPGYYTDASGTPWVKTQELQDRILHDTEEHITDLALRESSAKKLPRGTLLMAMYAAPTAGRMAILGREMACSQAACAFQFDPAKADVRFMFYQLLQSRADLHRLANGAAQQNLSARVLRELEVLLPPLDEQRAIAATLGALDDKIESLQKSVRLAQDLAQSTFKAWFVSGEHWGGSQPSDWKSVKLRDICELRRDAVKAGQFTDLPYVPVDALQMKNLALHNWRPNSEAQSSLVRFEEDDILIGAMRVYFHRVAIAPFAGLTRTTAFTLRPKQKSYLPFSLLLCNEETTIEFAQTTSKGSTMPYAVWEGGLASMEVLLPPEEVLKDFARSVAPLINFVKESGKQLQALSDLRDVLLPQLLSGRIRVGEYSA